MSAMLVVHGPADGALEMISRTVSAVRVHWEAQWRLRKAGACRSTLGVTDQRECFPSIREPCAPLLHVSFDRLRFACSESRMRL